MMIDSQLNRLFPAKEYSLRHLTELALIRSIPDLTLGTLKPSRKKSLFLRLQAAVDKDLRNFLGVTEKHIDEARILIEEFGRQTGWLNTTKHVGTLFSFCLEVMEKSEFKFNPAIREIINEIVKHLEAGQDFPFQSCWAGSLACEKWEGLFRERMVMDE